MLYLRFFCGKHNSNDVKTYFNVEVFGRDKIIHRFDNALNLGWFQKFFRSTKCY